MKQMTKLHIAITGIALLWHTWGWAAEPRILEWDQMMPPGYVESLLEESAKNAARH